MALLALRLFNTLLLIVTLLLVAPLSYGTSSDEYTLKAFYIFNFAKFTEWPDESFDSRDATLNLCVLGEDPFGVAVNEINGKKVKNHSLRIIQFPRVAVVSSCHILFISRSEQHRLELILKDIGRLPILTVSDMELFSDRGGMVTLLTQDQLVQFAVNPYATALAGIKISSKLLELASVIVSTR